MSQAQLIGQPSYRTKIQAYLDVEKLAVEKNEFRDGLLVQMPAGTYTHSRIIANLPGMIHGRLQGTQCFALQSNMRLRIDQANGYFYPDI